MKFQYYIILILFISCKQNFEKAKPNFIFYISDDQDYLDYKIYGNDLIESSAVTRLAEEGITFNNAYTSQAICSPSRSQLFTGLNPLKNGSYANHLPVKPTVLSITKYLKDIGYEVYLAGKSHVKPDTVFNWTHYFPLKNKRYFQINKLKELIINSKNPYCLFIASTFPHEPYINNTDYTIDDVYKLPFEDSIKDTKPGYYSNVKIDNDQLTEIINTVDSVDNNTIFFYLSDHGISGKWGVKENGLRIPLIIRWPNVIKSNVRSDALINIMDIMPTVLDIAGTKIPQNLNGKSFFRILKNKEENINNYIFGMSTKQNVRNPMVFPSRSVRDNQFKLIINFNSIEVYKNNLTSNKSKNIFIERGALLNPNIPYMELYDLINDPHEKINLVNKNQYSDIKNNLDNILRKWMKEQNDFISDGNISLIKPTRHPLDKISKWNPIPKNLENILKNKDYIKSHY